MTKQKLNVKDYIFEYDDKQFRNVFVNYDFKETVSIPRGTSTNYLLVQLSSNDDSYTLELFLNLNKAELKNIPSKFININDKVRKVELYEPNMTRTPDLNIANVQDLYSNPSNIWIKKESNDSYYIKLSLPEYKLFALFKINIV